MSDRHELEVDKLLSDFQRACEVVEWARQGGLPTGRQEKERAIFRNEIRARLLAASSSSGSATASGVDDENSALRMEWWLSHGCPFAVLYGDDGEMQCHVCGIDFKRSTPREISAGLKNARLLRAASPSAAAPTASEPTSDTEPWFGCFTGDCPHEMQADCDRAIRQEFARLEKAEADAASDTERLDTLERLAWFQVDPGMEYGDDVELVRISGINDRQYNVVGRGRTLREAIDAARSARSASPVSPDTRHRARRRPLTGDTR